MLIQLLRNALNYAKSNLRSVAVVGDDTDGAVMLVHHWRDDMQDIFFLQERYNKARSVKYASLRNVVIKEHLLFLHAWSG